jgi:hypothetical protein
MATQSRSVAAMKTRTYFAFRIDVWDDAGNSIFEHIVGAEDFEVAVRVSRHVGAGRR